MAECDSRGGEFLADARQWQANATRDTDLCRFKLLLMGSVKDLEAAVKNLSAEKLAAFRKWLIEFDAAAWDRQIEADVHMGRLDSLAAEALADLDANRCTDR